MENRRPVWEALSGLYLDSDISLTRAWRAKTLAESAYSLEDLEAILVKEVDPVCRPNLQSVAGEWTGFDMAWMEAQILEGSRGTSILERFSPARFLAARAAEWLATREDIVKLRMEMDRPAP